MKIPNVGQRWIENVKITDSCCHITIDEIVSLNQEKDLIKLKLVNIIKSKNCILTESNPNPMLSLFFKEFFANYIYLPNQDKIQEM